MGLIHQTSGGFGAMVVSAENGRPSVCDLLRPSESLCGIVVQTFEVGFPIDGITIYGRHIGQESQMVL